MTASRRRNLVVVRAGDHSLHPGWMKGGDRDFDVFVSYYGTEEDKYAAEADHYEMRPGPKWPCLADLMEERGDLIEGYHAFWFPDDDLDATSATLDRMFAFVHAFDLALAQPALTEDSHFTFPILVVRPEFVLRHVGFVEVMAPIFSRAALRVCHKTFRESQSGWGLDWVWPDLVAKGQPERVAVLDATPVRHTRAIGGGDLYARNPELRPKADLEALLERYGLSGRVVETRYRIHGGIGRRATGWGERCVAKIRTWYDGRRARKRRRRKAVQDEGL